MTPRGVLPTYVSEKQIILCKAAPTIRNAYEIRLAQFMAANCGREFVLAVSPNTRVDPELEAHIRQHGGDVVRAAIREHSVYVGAIDRHGKEGDGWVAGDSHLWASVLAGLRSSWLRDRLLVGGVVSAGELPQFRDLLSAEAIAVCNIDDENIRQALLNLVDEATIAGGSIFVQ